MASKPFASSADTEAKQQIVFAGDLVESQAALYTGDAFHFDWAAGTLDRVKELRARQLVGGRGRIARGRDEVDAAIEQTRGFLLTMQQTVGDVHRRGGTLKEAFDATHAALAPPYGAATGRSSDRSA